MSEKVYMLVDINIQDKETYLNYEKGFFPILKKHNGIFLTYDDNHQHKEGVKKLEGRVILFGFPSQQDADNWFEDPEYQTLSEHRKRGTKTQFITFIKTLER